MPKDKKEAIYTIPIYRVYWGKRTNRAARAIKLVRRFIARHFGVEEKDIIIHNNVNEYIWSHSIERPPRRITVKAVKDQESGKIKVVLVRENKIKTHQR